MGAVIDSVLTVSQQVVIAAPRARVLAAWADPAAIARWYVERRCGDPRIGRRFTWYRQDDATVDARPPVNTERISFDNDGSVRGNNSVLHVALRETGDGTRVQVEQRGFPEAAQCDLPHIASGWACALATLKACLEDDGGGRRHTIETVLDIQPDPHTFASAVASMAVIAEWAGDQPSRMFAATPHAAVVAFYGLPGVVCLHGAGRVIVSHTSWGEAPVIGVDVKVRQLADLLAARFAEAG